MTLPPISAKISAPPPTVITTPFVMYPSPVLDILDTALLHVEYGILIAVVDDGTACPDGQCWRTAVTKIPDKTY